MAVAPATPLTGITPTVDGVTDLYPCLSCLDQTRLIKLLAFILYALQNNGSTDVDAMITAAKCYKCLSPVEQLRSIVAAYASLAIANRYFADLDAVIHDAWCLDCVGPDVIGGILVDAVVDSVNTAWPQV